MKFVMQLILEDAKHYDTARLRKEHLIETIFAPNEVNMVLYHVRPSDCGWSNACRREIVP